MPAKPAYNRHQAPLPFVEWGDPPPPRPRPARARRRPPRRGNFDQASADAAAVVRGVLVARLDQSFNAGELGRLLHAHSESPETRRLAYALFAEICEALFPEEFSENPGDAESIRAASAAKARGLGLVHTARIGGRAVEYADGGGLVPDPGPPRVGARRLAAFAALLSRG